MTDHLDKRKFTRKGFFKKKEKANPLKTYQTECKNGGNGYLAYRSEAHHVLPFEAIDTAVLESTDDDADKLRYIRDVQYITDWNLNSPDNLVGLPNIICYDLFYQNKANLKTPYPSVANLYQKFKNKSAARKREIIAQIKNNSPEGWPIHNPSNWGHSAYTAKVTQDIKTKVWDPIRSNKKEHEVDAEAVQSQLESLAKKYNKHLKKRGKGSAKLWAKRLDPKDSTDWYKPYTMYDVYNPIFG